MTSHPEESALLSALRHHDDLVLQFAAGQLGFGDFLTQYDNFYWSHALDGHEADAGGLEVLRKHETRIAPHQRIADDVLAKVILTPVGYAPDRISPAQAEDMLRKIAKTLAGGDA